MPSIDLTAAAVSNGATGSANWALGSLWPCSVGPEPTGAASAALVVTFAIGSALPSNATVTGWALTIARDAAAGGNIWDVSVTATVGGKGLDDKAATGTLWPASTGDATYGGASDLWGDTAPTYSQVNTLGATAGLSVKTDGSAGIAYVRGMSLTVYYTTTPNQVVPHCITLKAADCWWLRD